MNAIEMIQKCGEGQGKTDTDADVAARLVARRVLELRADEWIREYAAPPVVDDDTLHPLVLVGVGCSGMLMLCGLIRLVVWLAWRV